MIDDRQSKLDRIFAAAVEIHDESQRREFIRQACDGDAVLLSEVEELLKYDDSPIELLDAPILSPASSSKGLGETEPIKEAWSLSDILSESDFPDSLGRIDKYEVLKILGKGGMGLVLRAFASDLAREVAIKIQAPNAKLAPALRSRFIREARAAATIKHPNVVTVYDFNETHVPPFLVMELVEGSNLAERISEDGPLPLSEAIGIALEVALGIAEAHAKQVIHRDIKPQNIMVAKSGRIKVLDLGVAKQNVVSPANIGRQLPDATREGDLVGTIDYMSPEQATGASAADERSDIYSLGCTLYYLVEGHPPFLGNFMQKLVAHREQPAPHLSPDLSGDGQMRDRLDAMLQTMLQKDPDSRQASMQEVIRDLNSVLDVGNPTPPPQPPFTKRRRLASVAGIFGIAAIAAVTLWFALQTPSYQFTFAGIADPSEIEVLAKLNSEIEAASKWSSEYSQAAHTIAQLVKSSPETVSFSGIMKAGRHTQLSKVNKAVWLLEQWSNGAIPSDWKDQPIDILSNLISEELKKQEKQDQMGNVSRLLRQESSSRLLRRWNIADFPPPSHPERQTNWLAAFSNAFQCDVTPLVEVYGQIERAREAHFGAPDGVQLAFRANREDISYRGKLTTATFAIWLKMPSTATLLTQPERASEVAVAQDENLTTVASQHPMAECDTGIRLRDVRFVHDSNSNTMRLDWSGTRADRDPSRFRTFLMQTGLPDAFTFENESLSVGDNDEHSPVTAKFEIVHRELPACRGSVSITLDVSNDPIVVVENGDLSKLTARLPQLFESANQYRGLPLVVKSRLANNIYQCEFPIREMPAVELVASFNEAWDLCFGGMPSVAVRNAIARQLCDQNDVLSSLRSFGTIESLNVEGSPAHIVGSIRFAVPEETNSEPVVLRFVISGDGRHPVSMSSEERELLEQMKRNLPPPQAPLDETALAAAVNRHLASFENLRNALELSQLDVSELGAFMTLALTLGDWPQLRLGPVNVKSLDEVPTLLTSAVSEASLKQAANAQWTPAARHPRFGRSKATLAAWAPESGTGEVKTRVFFGDVSLDILERVSVSGDHSTLEVYDSSAQQWRSSSASSIANSLKPAIAGFCGAVSDSVYASSGLQVVVGVDDDGGRREWLTLSPPSVVLHGKVHVPLIEAWVGAGGVTIDESGVRFSRVPITLARSFYLPHFTVSDPRIELDFENAGLKLGVSITPPMVPLGPAFEATNMASSNGMQAALGDSGMEAIRSRFGLVGGRPIRWDNPWLHLIRGDLEIKGSLRDRMKSAFSLSAATEMMPRHTLGAGGRLVLLQNTSIADCQGKVVWKEGEFDRLTVTANGDLSAADMVLSRINGEFEIVAREGASLHGVVEIADCKIDGALAVTTNTSPVALAIHGRTDLPLVGTVALHGMTSLRFDDYQLTAEGSKDFWVRRLHYIFTSNPQQTKFDWWWTTPDGREMHYVTEAPSIKCMKLDEGDLLNELKAVVDTSDDASLVKLFRESEATMPAPERAPDLPGQQSPRSSSLPRVTGGQVGVGISPTQSALNDVDLDIIPEGDMLRLLATGTTIEYGRVSLREAGVRDWGHCLIFHGWTEKHQPSMTLIEIADGGVAKIMPIVFESSVQPLCPATEVSEGLYSFAREHIRITDEDSFRSSLVSAWMVAESLELSENGYAVHNPLALGNGYVVTTVPTQAALPRVAVFCWQEQGERWRMSASSEDIDFDLLPRTGAQLMSHVGRSFERRHTFADVVVAFRGEDSVALLRQVGQATFLVELITSAGKQTVSLETVEPLESRVVRRVAHAVAGGIWEGQFSTCDVLYLGSAGVCSVDNSGWSLLTNDDIARSGWSNVAKLSRKAFDGWNLPSKKLLPPRLQSPDQRLALSSDSIQALAKEAVCSWESLKNKSEATWQAHPMGLMIELAKLSK